MFKLDLEKAEELEIKLSTSIGSLKSKRVPEKTYTFALLTMPKPLCRSQQTVENSSRDRNTLPASWEICMQAKKQLEWDMEQQIDFKSGKSTAGLYIVTLLI